MVIRSLTEKTEEREMLSNIIVAIMFVIAIAAGIFGWWMENGGLSEDPKKDDDNKDIETEETERVEEDEKN